MCIFNCNAGWITINGVSVPCPACRPVNQPFNKITINYEKLSYIPN